MSEPPPRRASPRPSPRSRTPCCPDGPRRGSSRRWTGSAAFTELLGDPQRSFPVIHLTGTNGKTSTSRMIDALLRGLELRTGRFTSPHVERMSERISIDGEPLSDEQFVQAFNDVAPYTHLVDAAAGPPAVVLRDRRRHGLRRLRRRPGRRGRGRGRDGRLVGRHQRRRRGRRGRAAGRGRPRALPRRDAGRHRRREGRDHQAGLDRGAGRAAARGGRGAPRAGRRGGRERGPRGHGVRGRLPRARRRGPDRVAAGAAGDVRRRVPAALRRPPGAERRGGPRGRGVVHRRAAAGRGDRPGGVRRGDLPGPAGDHPAQPDHRARRRPQPARRRGHRRRAGGLLHVLARSSA